MVTKLQLAKIRSNFNGAPQRAIFKILSDTNRYRIFQILSTQQELTVSDMAEILKISIPLASQHLKILELGGLLQKEKIGQKAYLNLVTDNVIAQSIIKNIL